MDGGDQAVVIARNIEHIIFPCFVYTAKLVLQVRVRVKSVLLNVFSPVLQRLVRMRVALCEQFQSFVADYPHDATSRNGRNI